MHDDPIVFVQTDNVSLFFTVARIALAVLARRTSPGIGKTGSLRGHRDRGGVFGVKSLRASLGPVLCGV